MLQLRNIKKTYRTGTFTQTALDDVSVSFRDNEFVAVLGPSGSGKTTMLNIVGGLDHYDSGDLVIDGISTKEYKDRDWDAYRNNRIGFVFQSYNLIPHQTVLANVELALTLSGVSREERHKRALEALERVGLAEHVNKKPSQLSGGQMQRVAIARALINDPEILLADEPTGALDSKTSVQVMDLLTEIANDRLVIMVTHNPELAERYATRIVNLADGIIRSDTDPYNPTPEEMHLSEKPVRRTSMSFLTALSLSFNNLMTKKGRTFMTAFAGSIGIIGIAAILALANGVNDYIASVEEETLSLYPLEIESTGLDMTSLLSASMSTASDSSGSADDSGEEPGDDADAVGETSIIQSMFSSISSNDLASLKEYLDSGESGIEQYARSIEYTYDVTPQIYDADTEDGVRQINPDSSFSSLGFGSTSSASSLSSYSMSTDIFSELPEDTSIIEEQYDVVAGSWPENYNECVIVLSSDGSITDFMSYLLGLRDTGEMQDMIRHLVNGEEVEVPESDVEITYDDLLGIEMKLVNAAEVYQYDSEYDTWVDKSGDTAFMTNLVNDSEDLIISGVVQPKEDASITSLSTGVYYTPELILHLIEEASQTQIVQEQLADPSTDVFSGKSFEQLQEEEDSDSGLDFGSMFTLDSDLLSTAFTFDTSALSSGLSDASALDLDLSNLSIDASSLPAFDASTLDLDLSSLDLDLSGLAFDLSSIDLSEAVVVDQDTLAAAMADVMTGFGDWYIMHQGEYSTAQEYVEAYLQSEGATEQIRQAVEDSIDMSDMSEQVSQQLQAQLATQMQQQVVPMLTQAIATALQEQLSTAMQSYLQSALTVMMSQMASAIQEQVSSAMEQSMSQITSNMSSAMNLDEDAFANAFQLNMDENELTELIMSLMSSSDTNTYTSNLSTLGYADLDEPSSIDIYPIDFDSKEEIVDILDAYNDRMVEEGQEDKQITYTDLVGTLMSSITTIIDMISYVLIAFVSISLVVSSIMIGVVTYISVLERRKEIGILRAIGASKGDVSRVFNAETIIEGLVSGLLGVGVTALLCIPASAIVYSLFGVPNVAQLPLQAAVVLVLISVALTFIAGLMPASSASRKDPVEALRSE